MPWALRCLLHCPWQARVHSLGQLPLPLLPSSSCQGHVSYSFRLSHQASLLPVLFTLYFKSKSLLLCSFLLGGGYHLKIMITSGLVRKRSHNVKALNKGRIMPLVDWEDFRLYLGLEDQEGRGALEGSFQGPLCPRRGGVCVSGIEEGGWVRTCIPAAMGGLCRPTSFILK